MGRFKTIVGGKQEQKQMTRSELVQAYEGRFKGLGDAIQQLSQIVFRTLGQQGQQIAEIKQQLSVVDVRTVAELELLTEKNILTSEEHTNRARAIRIREFDKLAAAEDEAQKLIPVEGGVEVGHFATVEIEGRYPETLSVPSIKEKIAEVTLQGSDGSQELIPTTETVPHPRAGERIEAMSILRSKVQVGSGQLFPELEKAFLGLRVGEEKDIPMVIPPIYKEFAGQEVIFHVKVFAIKRLPDPPKVEEKKDEEAAPQPTP